MKEKILIPYAPILVESTRSIGYSFESALADIIDNSISKNATVIDIKFKTVGNPYVAVIDDAEGMSEEELEIAMRYGSKSSLDERDENDLGRFGLGLKMASLSQCRKLTVVSKKNNEINAARWDLDHIIEKGDWSLQYYNQNEIDEFVHIDELYLKESGTIVIWEEFDRLANGSINLQKILEEKIEIANKHIALVFHRFLGNENKFKPLKIFFNNDKVTPIDPFLSNNPATQPLIEQSIRVMNSEITIKPYILPYVSKLTSNDKKQIGDINDLRQNQGFYIYRNKRLILWGTWFRLLKQYELNKLARIRVDIPNTLDSIWEIDIKKSTASLPDVLKRSLINVVENTVGKSEKVYKYRGRKLDTSDIQHVWNTVENRGKIQYLINRELPFYKMIEDKLDEQGMKYLDSFIKTIEDSFPFGDVYYRMAKNESGTVTETLDYDEVYNIALNMIDSIRDTGNDLNLFINNMHQIDFFIKYPEIIKKIKEDFLNE